MQQYKQLEDLGVQRENCYLNWIELIDDDRRDTWKEQRDQYGIDERETWNWSDDFLDYVYIHLKMFKETSSIIDFLQEPLGNFDDKYISVEEGIDILLNWFETTYYPLKDESIEYDGENYDELTNRMSKWNNEKSKMIHLFADLIPHLNW